MKIIFVLMLTLALLFTGACGSDSETPNVTESSQSTADEAFLEVVRDNSPDLERVDDDTLIDAGQELCGLMRENSPMTLFDLTQMAEGFAQGSGFLTASEGAFFIGAAAAAYCPDMAAEINDLANGDLTDTQTF